MKVILPFDEQQLMTLFKNKQTNATYIVDGKQSLANLNDNLCLYISNLNLNCDIDCNELTYIQKVQLMNQYLTTLKVCDIKSLTETLLNILWVYCGIPFNVSGDTRSILTESEIKQYINEHTELIEQLMACLYSVVAYVIHQGSKQGKVDVDLEFDVIDDRYYMPINFVNLLKYPDLILCYHQMTIDKIKYLKYQFETPIFNNNYFGDYVFTPDNMIALYVVNLLNGFK